MSRQTRYNWTFNYDYDLHLICLFDKIQISTNKFLNMNFFIYNLKYAFSSFPPIIDKLSFYLYANKNKILLLLTSINTSKSSIITQK